MKTKGNGTQRRKQGVGLPLMKECLYFSSGLRTEMGAGVGWVEKWLFHLEEGPPEARKEAGKDSAIGS